jgi:hypothetical protein
MTDEVLTRQCPCLRAFDLGSALGTWRTRRRSINDEGHTKFYPGSRPLGGGSLHPASNLVYEHSCLQGAAEGGWVCVCCNLLCVLSRGYPLVALYMQPVRVYKVFLAFYSKSKCWALRASYILRAGFFLGGNRVGKYRGPRGHTLVNDYSWT